MSRPEPTEPPLPPKPSVAQAYVLFGVAMGLVIVVGAPLQLWSMPAGLAITELALILLPAVLYARLKRAPVAAALGWKPVSPGLAVRAAVLGASAWGMAILVYEASSAALKPLLGADPTARALGPLVPNTWGGFALTLLVAAVLPGLCEETLFRGAIQGTLEKRGARKAVVVAAILFAVFHLNPWNLVPALALGLVFGTMVARGNSTVPAMIAHACSNAMAFGVGFAEHTSGRPLPAWLVPALAALFVLAFAEYLWRTRRAEHAFSPLAALPAELMPRMKRRALWAAVATVVLLAAAIGTARTFLKSYRVATDDLAPEILRNDRVLTLKERWARTPLKPGDVIAFQRGDKVFIRKVARVDEEKVWVVEKSSDGSPVETPLARSDIRGRMIYKVAFSRLRQ